MTGENNMHKCKYCDSKIPDKLEMCRYCGDRLILIRRIKEIINQLREEEENEIKGSYSGDISEGTETPEQRSDITGT